jgi:hypothetical protein
MKDWEVNMINKVINLNKKLMNNILIGLLLGSSMAISTQVQASQQRSRGSHSSQQMREILENLESGHDPVVPTKEDYAKLQKKGPEAIQKFIEKKKEQRKITEINRFWDRIAAKKKSLT